jgi:hypothetical protein
LLMLHGFRELKSGLPLYAFNLAMDSAIQRSKQARP